MPLCLYESLVSANVYDNTQNELTFQNPGDANVPLVPGEVKTQTNDPRMDPKLSPLNPNIIAFIHHNDVWVSNVTTGREKQLTWTHSGLPQNSNVDEPVSAGVPSFVVQEEFDRYTGYWWRPKKENHDNKLCILYEEVSHHPSLCTQVNSIQI